MPIPPLTDSEKALVESCIGLAYSLARDYARKFPWKARLVGDADDLTQAAILGISAAARKFDPSRGFKFTTYCFDYARAGILAAVKASEKQRRGLVDLADIDPAAAEPDGLDPDAREAVGRAVQELRERRRDVIQGRFYREQTLEGLAEDMNITHERVRQIETAALAELQTVLGRFDL